MARTTINSLGVPAGTITAADLTFPLTDFSSTGIDDNASSTSLTIDSSGNISVTGTVDGRDLAADGTKLDGIEASADVTDTTNVTAAGALMDSELTDLAGVKGVTISTLQPKPSEGAFADGDKTKLDGIATGADVTPSWVPSSDPSYLTSFDITTQTDSKYLRSDIDDQMLAQLYGGFGAVSTGGTTDWNHSTNARSGGGYTLLTGNASNGPGGGTYYHPFSFEYNNKNGTGNMTQLAIPYNGSSIWHRYRYSNSWTSWLQEWNSGNDGSGSGLDADTVDGIQASAFATLSGSTFTGVVTIDHNTSNMLHIRPTNGSPWAINIERDDLGASRVYTHNYNSAGLGWVFEHMPYDYNAGSPGKLWGATNDGSGSGLDADTIDGIQGSNLLTLSGTQTITGLKTFSSAGGNVLLLNDTNATNATNANIYFYFQAQGSNLGYIGYGSGSTNYLYINNPSAPVYLAGSSVLLRGGYEAWGTDNDGSGSGLDADTVDGIQGASFLRSDAADTATGVITFDGGGTSGFGPIITGSSAGGPALKIKSTATNGNEWWVISNNSSNSDGAGRLQLWNNTGGFTAATIGYSASVPTNFYTDFQVAGDIQSKSQIRAQGWWNTATGSYGDTAVEIGMSAGTGYILCYNRNTSSYGNLVIQPASINLAPASNGAVNIKGYTAWHAGNDGSGSGLDADLLDGFNSNTGGANIVLRTQANGYIIHQNWIQVGNSTGLYCPNGAYLYNDATYGWFARSSISTSSSIRLQLVSTGTTVGWWYADSSYNQGFLTSAGGWGFKMDNSGNVTATGNVTAYSDLRLKEDIKPLENSLAKVLQLRGVQYIRKDTGSQEIGVIAQEVEKVLPEVVHISDATAEDDNEYTDIRSVDYGRMVSVLIEAIKEQQAQINELKEKIKWQ